MIAQLTHLRPAPDWFDAVVDLLREWGLASSSGKSNDEMPFSIVSRDGDHLFVVSLHHNEEAYKKAVTDSRQWIKKLLPLLVAHQGPTYYGEVLSVGGKRLENSGIPSPLGIYIGDRL